MAALLGGEGIGKRTLKQILRKKFSATTLLISDDNSIVYRFNACHKKGFIVFMDEVLEGRHKAD